MPSEPVRDAESVLVPWDALTLILDRYEVGDTSRDVRSDSAVTILRLALKWFHERQSDGQEVGA